MRRPCRPLFPLAALALVALPAAGQEAPPAAPAAGPGYHIHIEEPDRVGDTETIQLHAKNTNRLVMGSVDQPLKVTGDMTEMQTVFRRRVAKVDAKGHATQLRVSVQSASGRHASAEPMKALKTGHAELVVALSPKVKVSRADGRRIAAPELELWESVFDDMDPTDPTDDSDQDFPETLHVGDTFERKAPGEASKTKGLKGEPEAKGTSVVTGSKVIGGATYLILKTHVTARVGEEAGLGDKEFRVTDTRLALDSEETAPTDPAKHLRHERIDGVITITGKASQLDLPVLLTTTFLEDMTVLVPKS